MLHTPKGDLRRSYLVSLKGQSGLHETFFIKEPADAEAYLSLPLPKVSGETSTFAEADRGVGDSGILEVGLGFNPAGFVAELCGSETFALLSITDRELLYAMCEREQRHILNRLNFVLDRGLGPYFAILGQEYLVPPLHGPRDFHDFNVRFDKPILDRIHDAGGRVHVHSHGAVRQVMDGFVELGADVLHPFEAPPLGDITPAEAKAAARGRITLEGNLQIGDMYDCSPGEIRAQTEALIAACFDDHRGLIVSPTASPYIRGAGHRCWPQYKAMIDTVLAWH